MRSDTPGWRKNFTGRAGRGGPPGRGEWRPLGERIAGGRRVDTGGAPSLGAFLEAEIRCEGGPFTFEGRKALRGAVDHLSEILHLGLPERTASVLKGTQVGMTTVAIGLALYCVHVRRLNVGYFLPDQDFANRFADTRIRPAIRGSRLAAAMRDGRYRGAAQKGLKEFPAPGGSRFLYILGLADIGNAISIPLDVLIRDEVDDLPPENLAWSNDRLDASRLALTVNLAMGRSPGAGIQAMYEDGDRRVWRVPCIGCGGGVGARGALARRPAGERTRRDGRPPAGLPRLRRLPLPRGRKVGPAGRGAPRGPRELADLPACRPRHPPRAHRRQVARRPAARRAREVPLLGPGHARRGREPAHRRGSPEPPPRGRALFDGARAGMTDAVRFCGIDTGETCALAVRERAPDEA
ncbi:MAG: phage terminase large subunit family protein, partial [bacterium]